MLLRTLRGTGPGVLFILIIAVCIFWAGALIHPGVPGYALYEVRPMPLYSLLKLAAGQNIFMRTALIFVLFCFILFLLVNFNTSIFFINERTFLPAFFYLLLISLFPKIQVFNPVLPATVFLMIAMKRIMDSYRKPGTAYNFFDAGIFIGVGTLFYADFIWFGLLLIAGIILLRSGNFKEIIISVLGLAAPFIITAGIYYVSGRDLMSLISDFRDNLFDQGIRFGLSRLSLIVFIYTGLMLVISAGFLIVRLSTQKIKSRKTFNLLIWVLLISAAMIVFVPSVSAELVWIAAVPASYLLAHYFIFEWKKLFAEIVFAVFLGLVLLVQVFSLA